MTLQGEIIDINHFKTDILADAIEDSRIDFEDTRYGKEKLIKPNEFSHSYTTNSRQGKTVVVCPYLTSSEMMCQVLKTLKTGMCK